MFAVITLRVHHFYSMTTSDNWHVHKCLHNFVYGTKPFNSKIAGK